MPQHLCRAAAFPGSKPYLPTLVELSKLQGSAEPQKILSGARSAQGRPQMQSALRDVSACARNLACRRHVFSHMASY